MDLTTESNESDSVQEAVSCQIWTLVVLLVAAGSCRFFVLAYSDLQPLPCLATNGFHSAHALEEKLNPMVHLPWCCRVHIVGNVQATCIQACHEVKSAERESQSREPRGAAVETVLNS